jgi:adenylate cyclase class 2
MVETEIKLAVGSLSQVKALLRSAGFRVACRRTFESNLVLDTAAAALRQRGHLLRLREYGGKAVLTFKGELRPGRHKRRTEVEIAVSDFNRAAAILRQLGYSPVFRYEKYRTEYRRGDDPGHALLDETPIGAFVELEGPGRWIDTVARELGKSPGDYITASYGGLYFAHCERTGVVPGHMVFD